MPEIGRKIAASTTAIYYSRRIAGSRFFRIFFSLFVTKTLIMIGAIYSENRLSFILAKLSVALIILNYF